VEEGGRIWLNLREQGMVGWAEVEAVEACPEIEEARGA
jgi:hypothetical protein